VGSTPWRFLASSLSITMVSRPKTIAWGLAICKPPPEKLLLQTTKKPDAKPGKSSEKSFYRMIGELLFGGRLDGRSIPVIYFKALK
jgi:hypothetical protein